MRREPIASRVLAALLGIGVLEVVRYLIFRGEYDSSLWLVIGGSVAFNVWFQWWTLPDTPLKAFVAAVIGEAGLPPAARIVGNALVALVQGLAPLIAPR